MSKTNLDINLIEQNQDNKYVTINEAITTLALAVSESYDIDLAAASGDQTLNETSCLRSKVLNITGAMAGIVNLIVPQFDKEWYVRHYGTGFDVTIKTAASASWVTISASSDAIVWTNGTDVFNIASSAGAGGAAPSTAKTIVHKDGLGGTTVIAIGANVDPNSVEVYRSGVRLWSGAAPRDYTVTESVPASGNYDQLTPSYSDAFPEAAGQGNITILYYAA